MGFIVIPLSHRRKWQHREVKYLAQGHTATWWSQASNPKHSIFSYANPLAGCLSGSKAHSVSIYNNGTMQGLHWSQWDASSGENSEGFYQITPIRTATIQKKRKKKHHQNKELVRMRRKLEPLWTVHGNVKWCICCGKQYDSCSRN